MTDSFLSNLWDILGNNFLSSLEAENTEQQGLRSLISANRCNGCGASTGEENAAAAIIVGVLIVVLIACCCLYDKNKQDQAADRELATRNATIAARRRMQEQNNRNAASNAAEQASRSTTSNGMRSTAEPTAPQETDLLRSLTPTQRNAYVSAVLNTEKYKAPNHDNHDDTDKEDTSTESRTDDVELGEISVRNCAICLESFNPNDNVCTSNNDECQHVFHRDCIHQWLLNYEDCPCCRRPYLSFDDIEV